MIIDLKKSRLFTEAPEVRFAKEYAVSPDLWKELWKRHTFHEYRLSDLCDFYELKTMGKTISTKAMQRWLWRTYVFGKAQGVMKMGVRVVQSEFFGNYEFDVVKELTKNLKGSVHKEAKILI
jgi:hypothetical protein